MSGADLVFRGTVGPGGGFQGSEPDPANWLGRAPASAADTVHQIQSTLTSAQTNLGRHVITDSARIGDGQGVHNLKWIAMVTGNSAPSAARIASFEDATGTFKLDRPLTGGLAQIGDAYRIFETNRVFPAVTSAQAASGVTQYKSISLVNGHGTITNANKKRIIFRDLGSAAPEQFSLFHQVSTLTSFFLQRSDDMTDLFDAVGQRDPAGFSDGFMASSGWLSLFDISQDIPFYEIGNTGSFLLNATCGIWLRRTIAPGSRFRRSIAFQVLFLTDLGGADPDPLSSSCVIAYDIEGEVVTGDITPDRYTFTFGGSRLTGEAFQGGSPLGNRPVRWDIRPGDLGTILTDDDPLAGYDVTNGNGEAFATFLAPELEAAEGVVAHPRLIIGAGDEVSDPQPRVSLSAQTSFSYAAQGEISLPVASQSSLTDPASGFWPGA